MSSKEKKSKKQKEVSKTDLKNLEKKRLKKYEDFMKDNHDWDFYYIIDLLRFKIKMTRKHILQNDIIEEETLAQIILKMTETEVLLERVISDEHQINLDNEFKEKFGGNIHSIMKVKKDNTVKIKFDYSEIPEDKLEEAKEEYTVLREKELELKKNDLKEAFDIMAENIWDWWD